MRQDCDVAGQLAPEVEAHLTFVLFAHRQLSGFTRRLRTLCAVRSHCDITLNLRVRRVSDMLVDRVTGIFPVV